MIGQILASNQLRTSSELAPNMFGASSELASVMEFGFYHTHNPQDKLIHYHGRIKLAGYQQCALRVFVHRTDKFVAQRCTIQYTYPVLPSSSSTANSAMKRCPCYLYVAAEHIFRFLSGGVSSKSQLFADIVLDVSESAR